MSALRLLTDLVQQENPHVRSALRKTEVLAVLVEHAQEPHVAEALAIWARNKRNHAAVSTHCDVLVAKLSRAECRQAVRALTAVLHTIVEKPCFAVTVSVDKRLELCHVVLAKLPLLKDYSLLSSLCATSAASNQPSVTEMMIDDVFDSETFSSKIASAAPAADAFVIDLCSKLASLSPSSSQRLLRRAGTIVCARFAKRRTDRGLMPLVALHVDGSTYRHDLLDPDALSSAVLVDMMYSYVRQGIGLQLTAHPLWGSTLEGVLCAALDAASPFGRIAGSPARACSVLLTVATTRASVSSTTEASLRGFLRAHPDCFKFDMSENAGVLRTIISAGRRFHVPDATLTPYILELDLITESRRAAKRLDSLGVELSLPDGFHCPVTMEVMRDPVVASDGHTYERAAIAEVMRNTAVSPMTRERLDRNVLLPNLALKKRIRAYVDEVCEAIEGDRAPKKPRTSRSPKGASSHQNDETATRTARDAVQAADEVP